MLQEGRTRRDRLESRLARAIRKNRPDIAREIEAQLVTPPFPVSLSHVWIAWARMRRRIAKSEAGTPIGWQDIDAFCRRTQTHLSPHDIELIEKLDDMFLEHSAQAVSAEDKQRQKRDALLGLGRKNA